MALEPAGFYQMVIRSLRQMDEEGRRKVLEGICSVFDDTWETTVVDRHALLPDVVKIDSIDGRWLKYLAPLLGFTADKTIPPTDDYRMRRVLRDAVPYWNARPSEEGVLWLAVRMCVPNFFRIANFFDLRMQIDQTALLEGRPGVDPYALGFYAEPLQAGTDADATSATTFLLNDLSAEASLLTDGYAFLRITSGENAGVYRIREATARDAGEVFTPFPNPSLTEMPWRLYEWMDEYLTHLRVVDPAEGGDYAVPSALLSFLIDFARSHGERVDVHHIWFLDQFFISGNLDQWTATGGDPEVVPESGVKVDAGQTILSNDAGASLWDDVQVTWTVNAVDVTSAFLLSFRVTDIDNRYAVALDYDNKNLALYTYVSGTPTQLGATISVPYLKAGVEDTVRVSAVDVGTGVQLRVWLNGELELQHTEDPRTQGAGQVAVVPATQSVWVTLVKWHLFQ